MVNRENLICKKDNTYIYIYIYIYIYTVSTKSFVKNIFNSKSTFSDADEDQSSLLIEIMNFRRKTKPRKSEKQQEEKTLLKAHIHFLNVKK